MKTTLSLIVAALCFTAPFVSAQIAYQGRLTDATGAPNPGTTATIAFSLFANKTGGSPSWGPQTHNVDLVDGRFSVVLGPTPDSGSTNINTVLTTAKYLEITFGSTTMPRQEIMATPRALSADLATSANQVQGGTVLSVDNSQASVGVNKRYSTTALTVAAGSADLYTTYMERSNGDVAFAVLAETGRTWAFQGATLEGGAILGGGTTINDGGTINGGATVNSGLTVNGPDNNGTTAAVKISSTAPGIGNMLIDGNEIDSDGKLFLNDNSDHGVQIGGSASIEGGLLTINAANSSAPHMITMTATHNTLKSKWEMEIDADDPTDPDLFFELTKSGGFVTLMGWIDGSGDGFVDPSDRRLKENIEPLEQCLDTVLKLQPSRYALKAGNPDQRHVGFIAQEVDEVIPELVDGQDDGTLGLHYKGFGVLAIGAIQELSAKVSNLEKENAQLRSRLDEVEATVTNLATLLPQPKASLAEGYAN